MPKAASDPRPAPIAGASLREAKRSLRARMLREREAIPAALRAGASAAITATLTARGDFRAARTVFLTLAFGSEWDTRALVSAALVAGKLVAAPRVNIETRMLELCSIGDLQLDLAAGYKGIFEPRADCTPVALDAIDWMLVPGVAFDASGRRIGYGGGYYDRLLPLLRSDVRRIAGAFEAQIVEHVPAARHDLRMDAVVTERRTIDCGPRIEESR